MNTSGSPKIYWNNTHWEEGPTKYGDADLHDARVDCGSHGHECLRPALGSMVACSLSCCPLDHLQHLCWDHFPQAATTDD